MRVGLLRSYMSATLCLLRVLQAGCACEAVCVHPAAVRAAQQGMRRPLPASLSFS